MLGRVFIVLAVIAGFISLYLVAQRLVLKRRATRGLGFEGFRPGRPAILYFTAPGCVPCRTVQRPALEDIAERYGEHVQIFEFDAIEKPHLANLWGVLSVPTTFLIDPQGRPRAINNRATRSDKLIAQLNAIAELTPIVAQKEDKPLGVTE
jgi:thiol-disulfide isomerase/thioredoxin